MALSFSRPDPSSPASIADATFSTTRRGFDQSEVREVLRDVAAELGRLIERERFLQHELREARETSVDPADILDEDTVSRVLGEETLRVLQTARESATQIKARAEESAARIIREASEQADRMRSEAEVDAARIRADASADAAAEVSLAKQQGREMVNEARAYRERVLSELGRRREAARQQIEQLASGRDRLLQVFERARLVAVDVMSDLAPLGEPDEYVNLSPTTGPIPLMVPAGDVSSRQGADAADDLAESDADPDVDATEPIVTDPDEPELVEPDPDVEAGTDTGDDLVLVEDDPAEGDDPADEIDSADGTGADGAADAAPEEPAAEPSSSVESSNVESSNVVSLFGGRESTSSTADGLFARLRAETSSTEPETGSAADAPAEESLVDTDPTNVETDVTTDEAIVDTTGDTADDTTDDTADDTTETVFERRDADLVPLILASARKLKRTLADEQNEALDTLRGKAVVTDLDDLVPIDDAHVQRYVGAIEDELLEAARAGAALFAADGDTGHDTGLDAGALEPAHALVADGLVRPLRMRLERAVADGNGENDEVARRVRAVYREWKTTHIDHELDDVLRLAHGVGALAAVVPGSPMCWAVDPHGPACPDAEDNALAGTVAAGDEYPTGHRVAPAHAGCRCLIVPTGN